MRTMRSQQNAHDMLSQLTRDINKAPTSIQRRARITLNRLDNKFDELEGELLKIQDEINRTNEKFNF